MDDIRRKQLNKDRLSKVLPDLRAKVETVIAQCEAVGIKPLVTQGFRSIAEQNALYALGRTKPGKIVTNARGGQSNHNFGKAVDFAFIDKNGNIDWSLTLYKKLATFAKAQGLHWGGDWKRFKDYPHIEL